jgi:hypothetical protein
MKANDRAVSAPFYEMITTTYPALKTNPAHARLFGYLAWGTWRDDYSGRLVLGSELLAQMCDRHAQWKQRNLPVYEFLNQFTASTGIKIEWSNWDGRTGLSRVLMRFPLPSHVLAAVTEEQCAAWKSLDLVSMTDGTKYNKAKQRAWRETDRSLALERIADALCPDAAALGEYLNTVRPNRYESLLPNLMDAARVACGLPNPESANHQLRVLRTIRDQPVPFYSPSSRGRTVRLFGMNESLLALKKDVRKALAPSWRTADLRSAQLAIVARQWHIPQVQAFLRDYPGSIWDYLFAELKLERTDERKQALKDALYSAIYGRAPAFTASMLSRTMKTKGIGFQFLRLSLIQELFESRDRMFQQVKLDGGARDVYGRWIALRDEPGVPNEHRVDAASILAQLAQAMEMRLLSCVIHSAIEERQNPHGWSLMLWKHDGFNWISNKAEDEARWIVRLQEIVQYQADAYGIQTQLEIE